MWKEVLDFDMPVNGQHTPVKDDRRRDRSFIGPLADTSASRTLGSSTNWLANQLAAGEFVRIRPAGVESGSDSAGDCRGMDAADIRQRSGGRRDR